MDLIEFKKKLEDIPNDNFIHGLYTDGVNKCCVLGHYNRLSSENPDDYRYTNCAGVKRTEKSGEDLREQSHNFLRTNPLFGHSIASVNNTNGIGPYNEETIKERVMHLLSDMIEGGYV